jgi:hypothetical protein
MIVCHIANMLICQQASMPACQYASLPVCPVIFIVLKFNAFYW